MNITTMQDTFREYIKLFNGAVEAGDSATAIRNGQKLLQIADAQLASSTCSQADISFYQVSSQKVREYLADMATNIVGGGAKVQSKEQKPHKWFSSEVPNLTLNDIAGLDEVKEAFTVNVLAPLSKKYAEIYRKYRGEMTGTQILLIGPPGCGKTLTVRALAGTLNCHFAVVQTKDVLANLVGDAEKHVADIFAEGSQYDRSITFFDEIDSIAASREVDESKNTKGILTTLLTMMDGFTNNTKPGQLRIIIAATNRPWILDSAIKRGGRFETQIYIPLPDEDARAQLVRIALRMDENNITDIPLDKDVTIDYLVDSLEDMSGADIKAVIKQIVNKPLKREIEYYRETGEILGDCVTRADCENVISTYINCITDEMRLKFDAYSANMDYEEYLQFLYDKNMQEDFPLQKYQRRVIDKMVRRRYL